MLNKFLLEHMKENNLYFRGGDLSKNIITKFNYKL